MTELIKVENGQVFLSPQEAAQIAEFEVLIKSLKEQEDALKARILAEMEAKNILKIETPELAITYIAPTDRETFDSKALRKDHPELYDDYVRMSPVKASVRVKVK